MMSARAPCKSALTDLITSSTDGWAGGAAGAWDCAAAAEAMSESASTATNESGLRTEYPPILVTSTLDRRRARPTSGAAPSEMTGHVRTAGVGGCDVEAGAFWRLDSSWPCQEQPA